MHSHLCAIVILSMKRQNDSPNPKFILIMNYILLFLFAAMTALTANAQVVTEAKSIIIDNDYYIPEAFRYTSGSACSIAFKYFGNYEMQQDGSYDGYCEAYIYDENLNIAKTLRFPGEDYPPYLPYYDYNLGDEGKELEFTQTLFNDDEKFEYVTYITERRLDEYGDYIDATIGLNIVSEDGTILQSLYLPEGRKKIFDFELARIYAYGKNYYLAFGEFQDKDGECYVDFYKINKDASDPSKVSISTEPKRMSVSPRMVGRNEDITVAAETEDLRDVVVTDASGRRVYSTRVSDGQRAVRINANRLTPGMNVVNVKDANGKNEDFKVIVK